MIVIDDAVYRETIAILEKLVAIRSVNPPGGEDEIAQVVKNLLSKNGIDSTSVPLAKGRSSLVARIPGRESGSVVLCGHLDTVNADEEKWTRPPFEPRIEGDRMWGLGSADMKSGVATIIEMALLLTRGDMRPKKDTVFVFTADEEYAYTGAASVAKSGLIDDAQFLLITEPTAGKAYCGQKGELWVEAKFTGRAAHGSIPASGISAVLPAARFCLALNQQAKGFAEYPGRGCTSLNIGQFDGGWQVNIVPDTARVKLDIRTVSVDDKKMVLELIEKLGRDEAAKEGARFAMNVFSDKDPIVSNADNQYVQALLSAAAGNGRLQKVEIAPYSTDAVEIVPRLGVPVVIYGPGDIVQAHQPDEFLDLSSLREALDVIASFMNGALEI
ncbi:MAG: M20 family metallopeptidase [Candidatus Bipolaricaulota bacterium]|nr:M20 family metallopeptidase [Candidatus Bipolaricaulota bacterium]